MFVTPQSIPRTTASKQTQNKGKLWVPFRPFIQELCPPSPPSHPATLPLAQWPLPLPLAQCTLHAVCCGGVLQVEAAHALCYYHDRGLIPELPTLRQVQQLLAVTNGNAKELRQLACRQSLLQLNEVV